jgi:hypothetical protein
MAIATVVEETFGVLRYQIVQTAPATLTIRLDIDQNANRADVAQLVKQRVNEFLRAQGAAAVTVSLAEEPPQPNPRNGKLRHVVKAPPTPQP